MKRLISFVLVFCVFLSLVSVPVYASDTENSESLGWFNFCDYLMESASVSLIDDYSTSFAVSFEFSLSVNAMDIVIFDSANVLAGYDPSDVIEVYGYCLMDLTIYNLGDGFYRLYAESDSDLNASFDFEIAFSFPDSVTTDLTVVSWYAHSASFYSSSIECTCDIMSIDYGATIQYRPSDTINYREWQAGSNFTDVYLQLDLYSVNWAKYDYIDFIISVNCLSFTSIAAWRDGYQLPISYEIVENSSLGTSHYTVSIRLDLRGLDRSNVSLPNVHLEFQQNPNEWNFVGVISCVGGIYFDNLSPYQFFTTRLFSVLEGRIWGSLNTIGNRLVNIYNSIVKPDSDINDMGNAVETQGQELDSMLQEMNSVTRPPLDDVDGDFSEIVSTDDLVLASQGLGSLLNNDIILSIFTMSLLLCLASYVFFGKK